VYPAWQQNPKYATGHWVRLKIPKNRILNISNIVGKKGERGRRTALCSNTAA